LKQKEKANLKGATDILNVKEVDEEGSDSDQL